jgi:DMSO/TMAO reductase YedYZ molybdopterin-dependent catalytic subunit
MISRRRFISRSALASLTSLLGMEIVFGNVLPKDYAPLFLDQTDPTSLFGKDKEMKVLGDRPWNVEALPHHLDDAVTPASKMFIRNNGLIPTDIDATKWRLTIEGESVNKSKSFSLTELKSKFKTYTYQLVLECGGNGRGEFNPPASGNQWGVGAISCAKWTGVRLRDVLNDVGLKNDAVYIGYYGTDLHLSGDSKKEVISRGVPMAKALQDETLLAFQMNGENIPIVHGFPLRLVAGGWPASVSGKWVNRIVVRNKIHDGEKMGGDSYRVPCKPVAPGSDVDDKDMCIIESMPVKSLITYPKSGAVLQEGKSLSLRGQAWAGELEVTAMQVSIDFGSTWVDCQVDQPANRLAWQRWATSIKFPQKGYYEVWAKATDSRGNMQPMLVPGWNPKGYLNNACHRIAIKIV